MEQWQQQDETLAKVRGLAYPDGEGTERVFFYYREGLLYRHWHPREKEKSDVRASDQLVLPVACRPLVLYAWLMTCLLQDTLENQGLYPPALLLGRDIRGGD